MGAKPAAMTNDAGLAIDEAMRETIVAVARKLAAPVHVVATLAGRIRADQIRADRALVARVVAAVGPTAVRRKAVETMVADQMNSDAARVISGTARVITGTARANSHRVREWVADGRAITGRHLAGVPKRIQDSLVVPATKVRPKVRAARVRTAWGIHLFPPEVWRSTNWLG